MSIYTGKNALYDHGTWWKCEELWNVSHLQPYATPQPPKLFPSTYFAPLFSHPLHICLQPTLRSRLNLHRLGPALYAVHML